MLARSLVSPVGLVIGCLVVVLGGSDFAQADLIARWTFDNDASDSSGNGLNGSLLGGAAAGVSDPNRSTGVLALDGIDDYVAVPHSSLLDLGGQFTITSWFKSEQPGASGAQHLLRKIGSAGSPNEVYYTRIQPGGSPLRFNVTNNNDNGSNADIPLTGAGQLDASTWYFLAATFDGTANQQRLFLDDVTQPAASISTTNSAPAASTGELRIGRGNPGGYFDGSIDDVRLYGRVLSISELETVADGGMLDGNTGILIPGDYNGDRLVDLGDLETIRAGYGTTFVFGDLEVWQIHYTGPLTQASQAVISSLIATSVPEPGSALGLALLFAAGLIRRRVRPGRHDSASEEDSGRAGASRHNAGFAKSKRLLASLLAILALPFFASMADAQSSSPNIVVIVSDDHHWRDYSYTGENNFVNTPNIDTLAREGLMFNRGYVPMSLCRPSLVTMLTGMYGVQNGVYGNDPNTRRDSDPLNLNNSYPNSVDNRIIRRNIQHDATLPKMLASAGYVSQQTGKLWEGDYRRSGFTEGFVRDSDRHQDNIAIGRPGGGQSSDVSEVTNFVDRAVADDNPFFAFYAPFLPHTPHNPHANYRDRYDPLVASGQLTTHEANYYANIDALDDSVGRIRSHIQGKTDARGNNVDDNTMYVYVADNGWDQDPNRQGELPGDNGKRGPNEAGIRTPILISWKDQILDARSLEAKLADTSLASSIDIAPTILAAAGLAPTERMEGVNLATHRREKVFGDIYHHDQEVYVNNQYRVGSPEDTLRWRWMTEGDWKLVVPKTGSAELYNLAADPDGLNNLANVGANADRVASMTQEVNDWYATNRPTTIYSHEFNGSASSIQGTTPDVIDDVVALNQWEVGPQFVNNNGEIAGRTMAVLPFTPEDDKRYELRTALSPAATNNSLSWVSFGFQEGSEAGIDPSADGVAWARLRNDASLDDLTLHGFPDGGTGGEGSELFSIDDLTYFDSFATLTLVLDTRDHDESLAGSQWLIDLLADGVSQHQFIFTDGNPDIGGINLGSFTLPGSTDLAGLVDYFQLIEIPTSTYQVGVPIVIPEPSSFAFLLMAGAFTLRRRRR
ncbi:sulfatase-like hydrolase/transferase [Rubripirellula obstinata]|nr:sulfatase-like hydrolase/transferase [Rubripirellula obstinata]